MQRVEGPYAGLMHRSPSVDEKSRSEPRLSHCRRLDDADIRRL